MNSLKSWTVTDHESVIIDTNNEVEKSITVLFPTPNLFELQVIIDKFSRTI